MCVHCWKDAGSPQIFNHNVYRAVQAIRFVYDLPDGTVGGALHAILGDENLEDEFFEEPPTAEFLRRKVDPCEQYCFDLLKQITYEERYSAVALYEGYFKP